MPADDTRSIPLKFWTGGVNSLLNPADITERQYAWAENILNRGGVVQTRPGYRLVGSVAGDNLQGFTIFTPLNGQPRMVVAVDGLIYTAQWPSFEFVQLEGLKFNPDLPMVNFCACLQSVKRLADQTLEVIEPVTVLMMGDGETAMGMWDGVTARHLDQSDPKFEAPPGLWMVWNTSRLWIGNGSQVRVSDLANPLSFYDDNFLATKSKFEMPGNITGMVETSNEKGILVFTERTTTSFQSFVPRSEWQNTPEFQHMVFPNIGCIAGRTAVNQFGLTYWYSLSGMVSLDVALNSQRSTRMAAIDGQMMRSKRSLASDMSKACAFAHDNLLLISVPSGSKHNTHTWVMDQAPVENLGTEPVWAGIWTGTRPTQWAEGNLGGRRRIFYASYDRSAVNDTNIHFWEAMRDDRQDAGGRIACQVQFGAITDSRNLVFKYVEFEAVEILGDVSLKVYMCGTRGPWVEIGSFELQAQKGSIGGPGQTILDLNTLLVAYKPQARTLRTREWNSQGLPCSPESKGTRPGTDKGFSVLFEWHGRMGIRDMRMVMMPAVESDIGRCTPSEVGQINIVTERGETP